VFTGTFCYRHRGGLIALVVEPRTETDPVSGRFTKDSDA